jgi:ribosome maturation factor RimP
MFQRAGRSVAAVAEGVEAASATRSTLPDAPRYAVGQDRCNYNTTRVQGGRMSNAAAAQVRSVIDPIVTAGGLDLEDVVVRPAGSRRVVQVVVDKDGGISLDDVAQISRACSAALDGVEVLKGAYVLEVTSPGVDRPLTQPRHWRRNVGRLVDVRRTDGTSVRGRLVRADDERVCLDVDGSERDVSLVEVAKGHVQVEFSRPGAAQPDDVDDDGDDDEEAGQ